jgi:tetratricopeptide (TPR) repeat protein
LALNTKQYGELHPEVAENLNSLGMIEKHRGEYDLAIEHVKRAISIIEQVFDPEHNKIASFANNLADVYSIQAKYTAATELYKRYAVNSKINFTTNVAKEHCA